MHSIRFARQYAVRLSPALRERAERVAAAHELRLSELVRDALRAHLDRIDGDGGVADADREL